MRAWIALSLVAVVACGASPEDGAPREVTQTIGAEGGVIVVDGARVTIPKGALTEARAITIRSTDAKPEGFVVVSRVFECGPSGTTFAEPVTMDMPFGDDGGGRLQMFWSSGDDPAFAEIGGAAQAGRMTATVKHFSSGFVGRRR